jgi:hypothetical protein
MKPMPEHGFCAHYVSVLRPLGISGGGMWLKDMVGTRRLELLTSTVSINRG